MFVDCSNFVPSWCGALELFNFRSFSSLNSLVTSLIGYNEVRYEFCKRVSVDLYVDNGILVIRARTLFKAIFPGCLGPLVP
jgi:hypothetical protein